MCAVVCVCDILTTFGCPSSLSFHRGPKEVMGLVGQACVPAETSHWLHVGTPGYMDVKRLRTLDTLGSAH